MIMQREHIARVVIGVAGIVIGFAMGFAMRPGQKDSDLSTASGPSAIAVNSPATSPARPPQLNDKVVAAMKSDAPGRALDAIRKAHSASDKEIVRGLVLYAAESSNELDARHRYDVLIELLPKIRKQDLMEALVPLLAEPPKIRDIARTLIQGTNLFANSSALHAALRAASAPDKEQLAKFLYESAPAKAIPMVANEFEPDEAARAAFVKKAMAYQSSLPDVPLAGNSPDTLAKVNELKPILGDLVRDERWWVRLYAATTMRRHWALRDRALVDALLTDQSATVRAVFDGLPRFNLYHRDPMPGREAGADADRLNNERLRQLQKEGALEIIERQSAELEKEVRSRPR